MPGLASEGGPLTARLILLDEIAAHLDPLRREALFDRLAKAARKCG